MGEFEQTPEHQIKRSEIEMALENQHDAMIWYRNASEAVKPDIRTSTGAFRNNVKDFNEGRLSQEEIDASRKRSKDLAYAREALELADQQLKRVSEKYSDGDPAGLPPNLL